MSGMILQFFVYLCDLFHTIFQFLCNMPFNRNFVPFKRELDRRLKLWGKKQMPFYPAPLRKKQHIIVLPSFQEETNESEDDDDKSLHSIGNECSTADPVSELTQPEVSIEGTSEFGDTQVDDEIEIEIAKKPMMRKRKRRQRSVNMKRARKTSKKYIVDEILGIDEKFVVTVRWRGGSVTTEPFSELAVTVAMVNYLIAHPDELPNILARVII